MDAEGAHTAIQLPEGPWWDWDVVAWDGGQFRLAADHDLTYHHGLELIFGDPIFVSCPSGFRDPAFRSPSPDELLKVTRQLGEIPPIVVAFGDRRRRAGAGLVPHRRRAPRHRPGDGSALLAPGCRPRSALRSLGDVSRPVGALGYAAAVPTWAVDAGKASASSYG